MDTLFKETQALNAVQFSLENLLDVQQNLKRGEWNLGIAMESDRLTGRHRVAVNGFYRSTESEGMRVALESVAAKVGEFIKNLLKKLAEYIKRFFAWISDSKSQEAHEKTKEVVAKAGEALHEATVNQSKKELDALIEAENMTFFHELSDEQLKMMDHQAVAATFGTLKKVKILDRLAKYKTRLEGFSEQVKKLHMYALDEDVHRTGHAPSNDFLTQLQEELQADTAEIDGLDKDITEVPESKFEANEAMAKQLTPEALYAHAKFLTTQADDAFGDHKSEANFKAWLEPLSVEFDKTAGQLEEWQRQADTQPAAHARHTRDALFTLLAQTIRQASLFIAKLTQGARMGFHLGSTADSVARKIALHLLSIYKKGEQNPNIKDSDEHRMLGIDTMRTNNMVSDASAFRKSTSTAN